MIVETVRLGMAFDKVVVRVLVESRDGRKRRAVSATFLHDDVVPFAGRPDIGEVIDTPRIDIAINGRDTGEGRQDHDGKKKEELEHTALIVVE
jgi:hypothetical protein